MDKLYEMKLYEEIMPTSDGRLQVMRVPGGWIYRFWEFDYEPGGKANSYGINSVFVPYNNEFQEKL